MAPINQSRDSQNGLPAKTPMAFLNMSAKRSSVARPKLCKDEHHACFYAALRPQHLTQASAVNIVGQFRHGACSVYSNYSMNICGMSECVM